MVAALVQWPSPLDLVLNMMLILILLMIMIEVMFGLLHSE